MIELMIFFLLKHFIADFILQTEYHLKKFLPDWGFFLPLLDHCMIHALFTAGILFLCRPDLMWLAAVDAVVHFFVDRIKAGPKYFGRFKALSGQEFMNIRIYKETTGDIGSILDTNLANNAKKLRGNTLFWWSLGLDQLAHSLTYVYIIWKMTL